MVCGHGSERIARLPLAAALNNPVASNSARNTRTLSDLGGLSTSTCSHETHRRAFPKLQPRHSHVRRPLVPNGGMTFALLAPCSLRPSGLLRCASSAPPGASVVSSQASGAKRRLRGEWQNQRQQNHFFGVYAAGRSRGVGGSGV
jgi:hypothetical protein